MTRTNPNRLSYGAVRLSLEDLQGEQATEKVQHQSRRGMNFEKVIELANTYYEFKGIALIEKQQVKTQVVTRKQPQAAVYGKNRLSANVIGRSNVDYAGFIAILGGRSIAVEAKTTSKKNFHVQMGKGKYDTIRHNQPQYLDQVLRFKGLAYWLIRFSKSDNAYMVPHSEFRKWANPNKVIVDVQVSEEEIAEVGYLVPSTFECHLDYLAPVIKAHKESAG